MRCVGMGQGRIREGGQVQRHNETRGAAGGGLGRVPTATTKHSAGTALPLGLVFHLCGWTTGSGHVPGRWWCTLSVSLGQRQPTRAEWDRVLGNRMQGEQTGRVCGRGRFQGLD